MARVNGPLVEVERLAGVAMSEVVALGPQALPGEVVGLRDGVVTVQAYEYTGGLRPGDPATAGGMPLSVRLGPGLLGGVYDGLLRPLSGAPTWLAPGARQAAAGTAWAFRPEVAAGTEVSAGDVLGWVDGRPLPHPVQVPPGVTGRVGRIVAGGAYPEDAVVATVGAREVRLVSTWPVRRPRPYAERLDATEPLVTGQRVVDLLYPVARGSTAGVPGGFGTGKTVLLQQLAKWCDADVIVYVGCGERGNEMAEVLDEFPRLVDPRTGRSIMDRTVLVVNTSNMPVAAREASVYVGATIAEYYRDMGLRVAVMADSLSRWAEALREIGARLQEMPGEEGYPTYLGDRLGKFFERAGCVNALGTPARSGSVTLISAISPPGGDFSEPVTQAALRVVGALWALDPALAHQRQFPAVDWETSYSLYAAATTPWFSQHAGTDWPELRSRTLELMQRDRELREIAGLVGPEALQDADRLLLESARIVRDTVLAQSAFDPHDAVSSVAKTHRLAALALGVHAAGTAALQSGRTIERVDLTVARHALAAARRAAPADFDARAADVESAIAGVGT